jgi:lysophospholipase L1-like esterase
MNNKTSRRAFFRNSALASAALALPQLLAAANPRRSSVPEIPDGAVVLFQGDSITDAGRRREQYYANDGGGMGAGYVHQIVTELLGRHPKKQLRCYNRGISGNKVFQLAGRWEDDGLNLQPDVLSILIGVNDYWHTLDLGYEGTVQTYERDYRALLDRTKKALPDVRLVIGEPFVVRGGSAVKPERWFPAFDAYRDAARRIAQDYRAAFIPYQSVFDEALKVAPVSYWCPDGVHPSLGGAYLMAKAWLDGVGE